jgi:hypothetical protein
MPVAIEAQHSDGTTSSPVGRMEEQANGTCQHDEGVHSDTNQALHLHVVFTSIMLVASVQCSSLEAQCSGKRDVQTTSTVRFAVRFAIIILLENVVCVNPQRFVERSISK